MKCKSIVYLPCVTLGLLFSSCGDKNPDESSSAENSSEADIVGSKEVESAMPDIDELFGEVEEMGKVAGFAKHLPVETEMFFNAQNIDELIVSMRNSEIGQMMAKLAKKEGDDIDEGMKSEDFQEFLKVAGEEVFISMGDGSGKALKTIGDTYSVYYRMYYNIIGKLMLDAAQGNDMMMKPEKVQQMVMSMMKPVFDEFLEMEDYRMPRVYAGFKVSNDGDRARYTKLLQETVAKALELNDLIPEMKNMFELNSSDTYGGFKGVKIDYAKLLNTYKDSPEMAKELEMMGLNEEYMKKFAEKFKDFKVTMLVGNYDDYVVIYFGDTAEGLKFTDQPSDSLLANDEMSFLKELKDKEVVSVTYVSKEISEELAKVSTMMEDLSVGVSKFLTETKSLGDTTKIQVLLKKMALNGKRLDALTSPSRFGSVAYLEDGFKMDSFHGAESEMYDLDTKRKLASIAQRDDAVL